ncbi:olfactory receptor 8H1-like [Spea bombifrons]|uniref:olfactory receptor 8H1-like n=1 Tax=Spea bombifrons TaxID=233779 RepID=UPI00234B484A|nr:olfactory receptor 8H1-like [Spea bombifrons]
MENSTVTKEFSLLGFSNSEKYNILLFVVFLFIYCVGMFWNLIITMLIYMDPHLHTPMYYFICNLSFVDISYTTVTLPKLMAILMTGDYSISFTQCFIQLYFFEFLGGTETLLLSAMAYDRYVAICFPLQYQLIMNKTKCVSIFVGIWASSCGNAICMACFMSTLSFCHSNKLQQYFCDIKPISELSCADIRIYIAVCMETFILGLCPFLLILISYKKIISCILHIKSVEGRKKAFFTCTSHLTVVLIFYGTVLWLYTQPPLKPSEEIDQVFSVLYTAVTPMLNPLIYSLRNKEIRNALTRLVNPK